MAEHIHKYKKVIMGGKKVVVRDGKKYLEPGEGYPVFKCTIPGCTHYVPRELAEGRMCICWKCGSQMIMTARHLRQTRPRHRECFIQNVA